MKKEIVKSNLVLRLKGNKESKDGKKEQVKSISFVGLNYKAAPNAIYDTSVMLAALTDYKLHEVSIIETALLSSEPYKVSYVRHAE